MGRIGCAVAQRLQILGVEIYYHNRQRLKKNVEKNIKPNIFTIWIV